MRTALLGLVLLGCGSGASNLATQNQTFYERGRGVLSSQATSQLESPFPPLDLKQPEEKNSYKGVEVLGGAVRFSRPLSWVVRTGSPAAQKRFIEYISPSQFSFTIYERIESPTDSWLSIQERYEEEAEQAGAALIGKPVPMAVWQGQGRAYSIRRTMGDATKSAWLNTSREYLIRSKHRVVLVQIVHQGDSPAHLNDELLRVMRTMQVF